MALARFFSIIDGVQRIVEDTCFDHVGVREILNPAVGGEVSGRARRSILACERKECPWDKGSSAHVAGRTPCAKYGRLKQPCTMSTSLNVPLSLAKCADGRRLNVEC